MIQSALRASPGTEAATEFFEPSTSRAEATTAHTHLGEGAMKWAVPSLAARAFGRLSASRSQTSLTSPDATTVEAGVPGREWRGNSAQTKTLSLPPSFDKVAREQPRAQPTFYAIQEWEGFIIDVTDKQIVARLVDLTAGGQAADDEASIPIDEISEDDRDKLAPGRLFRWAIGYQRLPGGTKQRTSQIVFRQLPAWTRRDVETARLEAAELVEFLDDNGRG